MMNYKSEECELCNLNWNENQDIIFENETCYFIQLKSAQDSGKVLSGAGLIIPKAHKSTVFELSNDEWNDTYNMLTKVKAHIDDHYRPDGYNVGWNVESVGGQHIFHAHLHVLPRYKGETLAGQGIRSHIKSEDNRLE